MIMFHNVYTYIYIHVALIKEFVRAVDAWRTAGKGKPSSASTSSSSSSVGTAGGKGL